MEKQRKKNKHMKLDERVELRKEKEIVSEDVNLDTAMEEISETSEKHGKKKEARKNKGIIGWESKKSTAVEKNEEAELELSKDKKEKRKKKESSDVIERAKDLGCGNRHKVGESSKHKVLNEEITDLGMNGHDKKKSHMRVRGGPSEEVYDDGEKRTENVKASDLEKNNIHTGSRGGVEDVKKNGMKKKQRNSNCITSLSAEHGESVNVRTIVLEDKESADGKECEVSGKKKKRKITATSIGSEKDEGKIRKEVDQVLSSENEVNAEDAIDGTLSSKGACDKKRKRKKEKKDGVSDSLGFSPEGISNKEKNDSEKITETKRSAEDKVGKETFNARKKRCSDDSKILQSKKKSRRVRFSGEDEVFPYSNDIHHEEFDESNLVHGKRFSPKEDEKVKEAVLKFIEVNQLGEEGLHMVLNCARYPQVRNCWKEIGASLPWRPVQSVYYRAHNLFERSEERKWDPQEYELIKRFHAEYGSDWKKVADLLGKQRIHVKDAWRRIRLPNNKKGPWSQDEYQALFDLVNMDLRMRAFEEKKTKHGMLRDNISWGAIGRKLGTRTDTKCCPKWYNQLTSSLVREGLWLDSDDYRLIDALQKQDACCIEDVEWDNLIEGRSGDVCRKRWNQMSRYIGGYREKSFIEQVDVLAQRYCPSMLEYRKD